MSVNFSSYEVPHDADIEEIRNRLEEHYGQIDELSLAEVFLRYKRVDGYLQREGFHVTNDDLFFWYDKIIERKNIQDFNGSLK
jgi:hypothetical protein